MICDILTPVVKGAEGSDEIESTEELLSIVKKVNNKMRAESERKGGQSSTARREREEGSPEGGANQGELLVKRTPADVPEKRKERTPTETIQTETIQNLE